MSAAAPALPVDLDAGLRADIASAPVVVFASNLTDLRQTLAYLDRRGARYRVVRMGMASHEMRERFHTLETINNWHLLPIIYVNGRFVGGYDELVALDAKAAPPGRIPLPALALGGAGLIPFVLGALALRFAPDALYGDLLSLVLLYAAVTLSFVGAVHWGAALRAGALGNAALGRRLAVSVAPALAAWLSFAYSPTAALVVMTVTFVAVYMVDRIAVRRGELPHWYLRLRTGLTVVAVASLLTILTSLLFG